MRNDCASNSGHRRTALGHAAGGAATGRGSGELHGDGGAAGQPCHDHQPVAWDFFELTESWLAEAERADAVCFGSLAQRSDRSRLTIHSLLRATRPECQRIFDVNLRAPFYTAEIVRDSLELASVMKMN